MKNNMAMRMPPKQAFTLVEMLVVIGIIGLLMGILTPTFVSIRDQGRQGKCKANLENLGRSLEQYISFNNDYLPPGQMAGSVETWATILVAKEYAQAPRSSQSGVLASSASPFRCPSGTNGVSPEPRGPTDLNGFGATEVVSPMIATALSSQGPNAQKFNVLHNWYGANATAADPNGPFPMSGGVQRSKINRPSDTATLYDGWSIHDGKVARILARHGQSQKTNIAFLDGQVQTIDRSASVFSNLNDITVTPRFRYKN